MSVRRTPRTPCDILENITANSMVKLEIHVVQKVDEEQTQLSVVHILSCGFVPLCFLTDNFQLWTDGGFIPQKAFVSKHSHPFQQ